MPVAERWRRAEDVLWRRSLDTVIVLPPRLDEPLTLAATGPAVWDALATERPFDDLVEALARDHGAQPAAVAPDVRALLEQLEDVGVVVRVQPDATR